MLPRLTPWIALSLAAATLAPFARSQAHSPLMIPFNTSFSHYDNHWIAWMPTHPIYEAVEVESNADPRSPNGAAVQVFMTERAGGKSQVRYFNTEAAAKAFRGPGAHARDIDYKVTGAKGAPQSVDVRFKDKDNLPVELSITFAPGQELGDLHAGLTNQMGHNRDVLFMIFFREKAASANRNRLVMNGQDFSITPERATSEEQLSRTGYRFNAFVASFIFGKSQYLWNDGVLANSWRRTFEAIKEPLGDTTYRSEVADGTKIEIIATSTSEIREYRHLNGTHTVRVVFQPAFPSLDSARDGQQIRYEASIDNFGVLVNGIAVVQKTSDGIVTAWRHESPAWAKGYHFESIVQPTARGYDLEVRHTQTMVR